MPIFDSFMVTKNIRHRGLCHGKEQTVSSRVRVAAGGSLVIGGADLLRMVPVGEDQRPIRLTALIKAVSGTPVLTNPSFSFGISPISASNVTRPDGSVYTPVTASATRLAASTAMGTDEMLTITEIDSVTDASNWGPFFVTMTPSGAGAFSVAGGDVDIILEVVFLGEMQEALPVYSEFNNTKYKN